MPEKKSSQKSPQSKASPKPPKKPLKKRKLFAVILLVVFIVIGVIVFFAFNTSFSANFADNVLRPALGDEKTIALESFFFNAQDFFNQYRYKIVAPSEQFTSITTNPGIQPVNTQLDLNPIPLDNLGFYPINGEGEWLPIDVPQFPKDVVLARTFLRTDPQRPYAIVTLIRINMKMLKLSAVAGTKEPGGGEGNPGPGKIPQDIQASGGLVAAFNGGFQEKDGNYGMVVGNKTYLPLLKGLATLVVDKNYNLSIIDYEGQPVGQDNIAIRQNGGMLVEDSQIIPSLNNQQYGIWGRTTTNSMYTWRSGIGITAKGNLIYAVGPSLVPETLAAALQRAGAVNAMQLDINPFWVRFVVFNPYWQGKYIHYSILKNMYDGGTNFLQGYQKDFFYLYKR